VTYNQTRIDQGGLMRCELETITDYIAAHAQEEVKDGLVLDCKYCGRGTQNIILIEGVWRWNYER